MLFPMLVVNEFHSMSVSQAPLFLSFGLSRAMRPVLTSHQLSKDI